MNINEEIRELHEHFNKSVKVKDGFTQFPKASEFFSRWESLRNGVNQTVQAQNSGRLDLMVKALGDIMLHSASILHTTGVDIEAVLRRCKLSECDRNLTDRSKNVPEIYETTSNPSSPEVDFSDFVNIDNKGVKGLVILEGADNTGKSTLAKFMEEEYGAYVVHHTWKPELDDRFVEYMSNSFVKISQLSTQQLVVVDRAWLSYVIYSKAYSNYEIKPGVQSLIDPVIKNLRGVTILCHEDDKSLIESRHEKSTKEELHKDGTPAIDKFDLLWGAGIKGIRNGKPMCGWKDVTTYRVSQHGGNMGEYCDTLFNMKFPHLKA